MITIRRAEQRGHFDHGWLDTSHTFSFADYYDPDFMGFRTLRVINEDRVAPGRGFGTHAHRDMEIVTCVLEGALAHRDSMGNGSVIRRGDVQRMSAGTGVMHSEMNGSGDEPVHFMQIWILPERRGIDPGYEQKNFSDEQRRNTLRLVASRDGRDGSVTVHQDASMYLSLLDGTVSHDFASGRHGWLQVARGEVELNGGRTSRPPQEGGRDVRPPMTLKAGDGAAISGESRITMTGIGAEFLLFDLN
ncbi:MAG TPA: pirin family protein [Thermoanaerobaculia bacterium]|nr:pirin family protein [Thermoanaerobaculia bacterium]